MKNAVWLVLALAAVSAGGLAAYLAARDADAKEQAGYGSAMAKEHPVQAKARLAALKDLWNVDAATDAIGTGTVFRDAEEVYLWSCRLLEAERALADKLQDDVDALLSHWQRMEQFYRKAKALFDTGSKGGDFDKFAAARYYRAEAELWLVAAGGVIPRDRLE